MLGQLHGIAETANAILTLVRALGIRSLGLEWSFDEVGELIARWSSQPGSTYSRGEQPVAAVGQPFDAVFRLSGATPATVPNRRV